MADWNKDNTVGCMKHMEAEMITYGSHEFSMHLWDDVKNANWHKPDGGLWACPTETDEWKKWCIAEDYHLGGLKEHFKFIYSGNTFVIDGLGHAMQLPWLSEDRFEYAIDFEEMYRQGVDGVFLTSEGQWDTRHSSPKNLYGWDVESIVILNPNSIMELV